MATFKITHTIYLFCIGLCIGGIVASGIFVASVLFRAYNFLPDLGMSVFESGILMTQIFVKLNVILNFTVVMIVLYEIYIAKVVKIHIIPLILSLLSITLILFFSFYYTPKIIEFQNLGAGVTGSPEFAVVHARSELIFKFLLGTLIISFIWRCVQFSRKNI